MITIATLTGSCILALGDLYTGMICSSDDLSKKASEIGQKTGEYVFRAPWNMDYDDNDSPYADASNLSPTSREAGWIKAGLFLYRFVPDVKKDEKANFCHFDIAGSIDMEGKQRPWRQKGFSSGIGVGLLTGLLTE
ncbi:hypothetical protein IPJ72_00335 [Candidatus Peregrinibacteria bacterium]|nr:MAG: hypothetical protein IPJ72_00335 [Candidatus Peregrinibacteria bacterium]